MKTRALERDSLVYIGAAAVNALVPFTLIPLLTRWLGPAGFGTMGAFVALYGLLAVVVGMSAHGRIGVVYFREGPQALAAQVGATFGVLAATAVPLALVLFFFGDAVARATGVPAAWMWAVAVVACGQFVVTIALSVWQSRGQSWRYGATQIGLTLAWASLTLLLVGVAGMGWEGRALGHSVAGAVCSLISIWMLHRAGCIDWNVRRWPLRTTLAFGIPLLPHALAAMAMGTVDRFALNASAGAADTGHYIAAFQIASLLTVLAAAFNQAWVPWLYARLTRNDAAASREIVRTSCLVAGGLLAGAAVLALASRPVMALFGGEAFAPAAQLLAVLAPAAAFNGIYYLFSGYLFFAGRTGLLSVITLSVATLQVALTLWLAREGGAFGVAWATLIGAACYCAATAIVSQRIVPMPWRAAWTATAPNPS